MDLATRDKVIELLRSEINKTQDTVIDYLEEAKNVQSTLWNFANSSSLLNAIIFSSMYLLGSDTENLTPGCAAK